MQYIAFMDWDDIKVFLAIERAGSVNAAAVSLSVDASTVGRRLAKLESNIGAELFERGPAGSELTALGERLLPDAEALEHAAIGFSITSSSELGSVSGTVRLATAEPLFLFLLPHLNALRENHPGLSLEIVTATSSANLLKREADLALRPSTKRPTQKKIVIRKLTQIGYGLFASKEYLRTRGTPKPGGAGHDVIRFDPQFGTLPQSTWMDQKLSEARTALTPF